MTMVTAGLCVSIVVRLNNLNRKAQPSENTKSSKSREPRPENGAPVVIRVACSALHLTRHPNPTGTFSTGTVTRNPVSAASPNESRLPSGTELVARSVESCSKEKKGPTPASR